jgi:hypothetical protein
MWCGQHANAGAGRIARDVARALRGWCAEAGFVPSGKGARKVFEIPRRVAERSRGNAVVNRMKTDASAHYNASPHIRIDNSALAPCAVLMGDVHHLDLRSLRADGQGAYCIKLIAWMDVATRRVWVDPKTCAKGESVRRADVNASLASVFRHPQWGSPDHLYVDNGSEYGLRNGLTEPMRLAAERGERAPVIRSTPYNARAKGMLEGFFGRIERDAISLIPGYGGGNRMRAKSANQGREIAPLDVPSDVAEALIRRVIELYNQEPQKGLGGLSPNEAYATRLNERKAVTWSIEALAVALAERTNRVVQKGQVRLNNRAFELHGRALPAEAVSVLHGSFIEGGVLIEHAGELTWAEEASPRAPLDPEGAKYSAARRREFNAAVRALSDGLPAVRPLDHAIQDHRPTIDLVEGSKGVVRAAISPKVRRDQELVAEDERRAHQVRRMELLSGGGDQLNIREAG